VVVVVVDVVVVVEVVVVLVEEVVVVEDVGLRRRTTLRWLDVPCFSRWPDLLPKPPKLRGRAVELGAGAGIVQRRGLWTPWQPMPLHNRWTGRGLPQQPGAAARSISLRPGIT